MFGTFSAQAKSLQNTLDAFEVLGSPISTFLIFSKKSASDHLKEHQNLSQKLILRVTCHFVKCYLLTKQTVPHSRGF